MTETSVEHATFKVERRFDATPAQVFAAWAQPAVKRRWFGDADGWEDVEHKLDFRVGGSEFSAARQPGGPLHVNDTVFLNIVPERRIAFAYTMRLDDNPISASLATVEIRPDGRGTRLTYTEQAAFFDGGDNVGLRESGWTWLLGQLEKALAENSAMQA
ncbi:MAG: SRPBCC family protein [Kiloniellaceae bacterium]